MSANVSFIKSLRKFRVVLPQIDSKIQLFETNFTMLEIAALRKAWNMIESKIKTLSQKIAMGAYLEHPEWIELFRYDGKIDNHTMIYHPLWVLDVYGNIIKTNLLTNYAIAEALVPKVETHWNRLIPMPYLAEFLNCVKDRLLYELQENLSPTTELGFVKLNQTILYFITAEQKRVARYAKS